MSTWKEADGLLLSMGKQLRKNTKHFLKSQILYCQYNAKDGVVSQKSSVIFSCPVSGASFVGICVTNNMNNMAKV